MPNKSLTAIIILSFFACIFAGAPDTLWTRTYGSKKGDDLGYSIAQTIDGGFIITGRTTSFGAGGGDVYLIRIDSKGDTLWTKTYGGTKYEWGRSVLQTNDGGFIVAGTTESFGSGYWDVYLLRTNSFGDTLWTKTYGGPGLDECYTMQYTNDSGFIITGYTNGCVYLIRTNSNCDTLWTKKYELTPAHDVGHSVQQLNDDGFIIAGTAAICSTGGYFGGNVCLIRTNSKGDSLWAKMYIRTYDDCGNSVKLTNDGGFIIAGATYCSYENMCDMYILRTNINGDTIWTKTYGGNKSDIGIHIQHKIDGGFIIFGNTRSFGAGGDDVYLININNKGDTLWSKTYGNYDYNTISSVQKTSDSGFIIVGSTYSNGNDVYVVRLGKETTGINDDNNPTLLKPNDFFVSYNHVTSSISISYVMPHNTRINLSAYDIKGKLVKVIDDKFMQKGSYKVNWDTARLGSGVYFFRLSVNGSKVSRKVAVIR